MDERALPALHELVFETAAEHVCRRVPIAAPEDRAESIRHQLLGRRFEAAGEIAICEGARLVGVLGLEELLAAPPDARARELMDPDPPVVAPGVDQEVAATRAVHRGESSLAVVDEHGRFVGMIPPQRLLEVLLWEHEEDMARLGGVLHGGSEARLASEEPLARRLWHRIPWLLVGLAGAIASADLMGLFHAQLEHQVLIAFFVPGVVYLADAVGTQTETLVIRGLSVGVPIRSALGRELATGLLIGLAMGALVWPVVAWRWGRADVATSVALALVAACATATVVAMALPWLLSRLRVDPAFGSGPLATVVQDLLSVTLYLWIATRLVA